MIRRILFISTVALATLVLFASSAFAHICYIASRSPQGAQAAATNSDSWGSVDEFLVSLGLCEAGIDHVRTQISDAGLDPDLLVINERTVMAQGRFRSGNEHLSANGHGVDWVSEEMFADFESWVGEGFALC